MARSHWDHARVSALRGHAANMRTRTDEGLSSIVVTFRPTRKCAYEGCDKFAAPANVHCRDHFTGHQDYRHTPVPKVPRRKYVSRNRVSYNPLAFCQHCGNRHDPDGMCTVSSKA